MMDKIGVIQQSPRQKIDKHHTSNKEQSLDDEVPPRIYNRPMIITQPHGIREVGNVNYTSEQNVRISPHPQEYHDLHLSWISMPRGFQTIHLSAENLLSNIEQLEIQPSVEVLPTKSNKQYRVKTKYQMETLFLAIENNSSEWKRNIFRSFRSFDFVLRDASGKTAFKLKKTGYTCGFIPGLLHKMTIETPQSIIGSVEQDFTMYGVSFTVYDSEKARDQPVCRIIGPTMCCCCCAKSEVHFQVISSDGTLQTASIMHQWDHLVLDYTLLISFPSDTSVKIKSLILGASFLLEALYFDHYN